MRLKQTRTLLTVCSVALSGLVVPAIAKPSHPHRAAHQSHARSHHVAERHAGKRHAARGYASRGRHRIVGTEAEAASPPSLFSSLFGSAGSSNKSDPAAPSTAAPSIASATSTSSASSSFASSAGSSGVVDEARRYLGTNPTGRGSLWCGAFMDMVLKRTGHPGGGNLATSYAHYGTRVSGPQVGAIAVMGRRGGGHVGVVSGLDSSGNPIIISGNHNRRVEEAVYPRGRIFAYVLPNA